MAPSETVNTYLNLKAFLIHYLQVKNVSKMAGPIGPPGFNGSRGPPGQAGSRGEQGPKGAGDFSACHYIRAPVTVTPGTTEADVAIPEPNVSIIHKVFLKKRHFAYMHPLSFML